MKNLGIRLLLLHYWKQEFKATDEAKKYANLKEKGPSQYAQRRNINLESPMKTT